MRGCAASSDRGPARPGKRPAGASLRALCLPLALLLLAGCASRRAAAPPVPAGPATEQPSVLPEARRETPAPPPLPGAQRVYPSQDERNRWDAGAPEAFPPPARAEAARTPDRAGAVAERESGAGSPPGLISAEGYSVQIFASVSRRTAEARARELAPRFSEPLRVDEERNMFKVRAGLAPTRAGLAGLQKRARELGFRDAFIVRIEEGGR